MEKASEIFYPVFDYIEELDAFIVNKEFDKVAAFLGIREWHSAVWIGRFFTLDSDYGEHWFDNWELREERQQQAEKMGIDSEELMIIDPSRFKMKDYGGDGPCHSDEQIKLFWTDVLKNLKVSLALMAEEARKNKRQLEELGLTDDPDYIPKLESRIQRLMKMK